MKSNKFIKMLKEPEMKPYISRLKLNIFIFTVTFFILISVCFIIFWTRESQLSPHKTVRYSEEQLQSMISQAIYPKLDNIEGSLIGNAIINLKQQNESPNGKEQGTFAFYNDMVAYSQYDQTNRNYQLTVQKGNEILFKSSFEFPINHLHLLNNTLLFVKNYPMNNSIHTLSLETGKEYDITFRTEISSPINSIVSDGEIIFYTTNDKLYQTDFSGQEHRLIESVEKSSSEEIYNAEIIGLNQYLLYLKSKQNILEINTKTLSKNVKWILPQDDDGIEFVEDNVLNQIYSYENNSTQLNRYHESQELISSQWEYKPFPFSKIENSWIGINLLNQIILTDLHQTERVIRETDNILSIYHTNETLYYKTTDHHFIY